MLFDTIAVGRAEPTRKRKVSQRQNSVSLCCKDLDIHNTLLLCFAEAGTACRGCRNRRNRLGRRIRTGQGTLRTCIMDLSVDLRTLIFLAMFLISWDLWNYRSWRRIWEKTGSGYQEIRSLSLFLCSCLMFTLWYGMVLRFLEDALQIFDCRTTYAIYVSVPRMNWSKELKNIWIPIASEIITRPCTDNKNISGHSHFLVVDFLAEKFVLFVFLGNPKKWGWKSKIGKMGI